MAEHSVDAPDQQAVYDLMRARLLDLFGPGGSFRITLGRPSADDAIFVSTVADTVAWEVAAALSAPRQSAGHHTASPAQLQAEHDELWRHIEEALLIRRTGPDSVEVDVQREVVAAASSRFRSRAAA